jgi:Na+/H+-translocating membrane pyrophosphatase
MWLPFSQPWFSATLVIRDSGGIQDAFGGIGPILLPVVIAGVGILLSIVGMWLVRIKDGCRRHCRYSSGRAEPR